MTLYRTIVADPPWPYPEGFARNKGGRYGDVTHGRAEVAPLPYPSLSLKRIQAMDVMGWALPDAWLFLWTTNRYLPAALDTVNAWGFTYKQTVVWHKSDGHPRFPATVAPNRAEFLLVCKRGNPKRLQPWTSNVVDVPFNPQRLAHSQKPEAFLDLIEQVCPGPYLELFARRNRFGWAAWGNEVLRWGTGT